MIERIHPACEPGCTHQLVPDLGGVIVQRVASRDRAECEQQLREILSRKPQLTARIDYLGISAEHEMHTWRVGGKAWKPRPVLDRTEGKQAKREVKFEHRPAVWTGTGHVDPVDFSRPAEPEPEPYPAPALTSDMPSDQKPSAPAAALLSLAVAHGWTGTITHAHGNPPHATHGRPLAAKASEAVRLGRGQQRAVAVRMGGSWTSLWTWSPSQFFTRHATLEAFKMALSTSSRMPVDNAVDKL